MSDFAELQIATRDDRILELEAEVEGLRHIVADRDTRKRQRSVALLCLSGILMAAAAGPPLLVLLSLVAAGAGLVVMVGDK